MTIRVRKVSDDLYVADLTLPDLPNVQEEWSTKEPISGHHLVRELVDRGCHSSDIGAAIYAVDAQWVEKLRGEYPPSSPTASPFTG
jgi:cell division septation protein DedD